MKRNLQPTQKRWYINLKCETHFVFWNIPSESDFMLGFLKLCVCLHSYIIWCIYYWSKSQVTMLHCSLQSRKKTIIIHKFTFSQQLSKGEHRIGNWKKSWHHIENRLYCCSCSKGKRKPSSFCMHHDDVCSLRVALMNSLSTFFLNVFFMQRRNTAYFKIAIFYKLNSIVDIAQQGQLCVQIYWTF